MKSCWAGKPEYSVPLPVRLVSFLKGSLARDVLDVGCGYGRACFFLGENGFRVVGVDVDKAQIESAVEEAEASEPHEVTHFLINDARSLCFPESSFDAATMLGLLTLASKPDRSRIIGEVYRVLRPSGIVFVEEFGRTWTNSVYAKRYRHDSEVIGEQCTFLVKDEGGNPTFCPSLWPPRTARSFSEISDSCFREGHFHKLLA
jgi:ubiquinone/menaquinone biosynthesis C-methylase UbiE